MSLGELHVWVLRVGGLDSQPVSREVHPSEAWAGELLGVLAGDMAGEHAGEFTLAYAVDRCLLNVLPFCECVEDAACQPYYVYRRDMR